MITKIQAGEKEITLLSNAATPLRFKQAFGIDLIRILSNAAKRPIDDGESIEIAMRLAYIMSHQAEKKLDNLSEEDFYEWLEGYETIELQSVDTAVQIWNAYTQQTKSESTPKKKTVRPKEK